MGSLLPTKCRHSDALVCHRRYIQFSNATLLLCAHDPPPLCQGGGRGAAAAPFVHNAGTDLSHKRFSLQPSGHLLALESLETMQVSWPSTWFFLL